MNQRASERADCEMGREEQGPWAGASAGQEQEQDRNGREGESWREDGREHKG